MGSHMLVVYYVVIVAAIAAMGCSLYAVLRLRRLTRGGHVGRVVNILCAFIAFFLAGYVIAPWMPRLPTWASFLLVGFVFLFGALFVLIVLWLIRRLVQQIFHELEM